MNTSRAKHGLFLILICALAFAQTPPTKTSAVEFVVSDYFGKELQYRVDAFVNAKSKSELAAKFRGLKGSGIPYARYYYRLVTVGTKPGVPVEGEVTLHYPEHLLIRTPSSETTVLPDGSLFESTRSLPAGVMIRGIMIPKPQNSARTWVILRALYSESDVQYKASVDPSGEFRIYASLWGTYTLAVVRAGEVLHVEVVSFGSSLERRNFSLERSLVIRLDSKPLPQAHVP